MSPFIKTLEIKNFKSIKHLQLDCKRVNVLIGKPNVGKSNVLEALGLLGAYYSDSFFLKDLIRYKTINELFYDKNIREPIEINTNLLNAYLLSNDVSNNVNSFRLMILNKDLERQKSLKEAINHIPSNSLVMNIEFDKYGGKGNMNINSSNFYTKKYDYRNNPIYEDTNSNILLPPNGKNLFSIFSQNKKLRKEFVVLLKEYGFDFVYLDETKEFVIQKNIDGDVTQFSYSSLADTFQRLFFHLAAIESNKDSILIFEEPESHSYPPYIWQLANRIALDSDNQYFIATHSPYMLKTLMQEMTDDNLNIWVTYFENYETKIHALSKDELQEMYDLGGDIFFNMDKFEKEAV